MQRCSLGNGKKIKIDNKPLYSIKCTNVNFALRNKAFFKIEVALQGSFLSLKVLEFYVVHLTCHFFSANCKINSL